MAGSELSASDAETPASNVTLDDLEQLHQRIEERAAGSHWPEVEALIAERNEMLADVSQAERPAALRSAQESTDRILALAKAARLELGGALAKLQKGKEATEVYRAHR